MIILLASLKPLSRTNVIVLEGASLSAENCQPVLSAAAGETGKNGGGTRRQYDQLLLLVLAFSLAG
jgi:hypothetical protein